jgi:predicted transcriptional regulator
MIYLLRWVTLPGDIRDGRDLSGPWRTGAGSYATDLGGSPDESTVRTVLRRLEEKDYITHTVDGRTYVFQATQARGRVAAKAVRRIVDRFCDGSVEEVLVGMIDARMFDRRQLDMLREKIEKAKKKR